jgi:hypothetical protein
MWTDEMRAKCRLEYDLCDDSDHDKIIGRSVIEEESLGLNDGNDLMENVVWNAILGYSNHHPGRVFHFIIKMLDINLDWSGYKGIDPYSELLESFLERYEEIKADKSKKKKTTQTEREST